MTDDGGASPQGGTNDGPTLREVANRCCKRIDVGAAVLPRPLFDADYDDACGRGEAKIAGATIEPASGDAAAECPLPDPSASGPNTTRYARTLSSEFNSVVIEHHLKWAPLCHSEPGPLEDLRPSERVGRYDFHHCDRMVDWALERGMRVKGHVLCWHVTTPSFVDKMSPGEVREQLRRHIFTTVGHFRGRIHMWDVVNESLAPDGSLADSVFLRKLGPSYIEDCFRWAHEADPGATLIYNDNKVEGMGGANAVKSDGFYRLLKDLKDRGVPVHGAGLQGHFSAGGTGRGRCPTPSMVRNQIRRLGQLGLKVNLSELDVRISKLPPDSDLRRSAQVAIYRDLVAAALAEPAFDGIWLWGFTDRHTWVRHFYHEDEPLILDGNYRRKPCYYGLREALGTLGPGGTVGGELGPFLESDRDADGTSWGSLWMQPEPEPEAGPKIEADSAGDSRPDWEQGRE